jgi:hypothetical protein
MEGFGTGRDDCFSSRYAFWYSWSDRIYWLTCYIILIIIIFFARAQLLQSSIVRFVCFFDISQLKRSNPIPKGFWIVFFCVYRDQLRLFWLSSIDSSDFFVIFLVNYERSLKWTFLHSTRIEIDRQKKIEDQVLFKKWNTCRLNQSKSVSTVY